MKHAVRYFTWWFGTFIVFAAIFLLGVWSSQ